MSCQFKKDSAVTVVATAPIAEDGSYCFENPMITQHGIYNFHVEIKETAEASLAVQDAEVELYPGYYS